MTTYNSDGGTWRRHWWNGLVRSRMWKLFYSLSAYRSLATLKKKFTKEQKQDLMHIAVCSLLSPSGYYELESVDRDGWPHFKQLKAMPDMNAIEQENFLKDHILLYFETHDLND